MKIKALWGFVGNAAKLGVKDSKVRAGQIFAKADTEYAHTLIGKGLAEEVTGKPAKAPASKAAAPTENKAPPSEPPAPAPPSSE